jgi:hypothetical protein
MFRRTLLVLFAAGTVLGGTSVARGAESAVVFDGAVSAQRTAVRTDLPRRATIISDSAMAGVRWNGALGGLRGFLVDDRLESCRRLVDRSCFGREGRRPDTAIVEIARLPNPAPSDVLVIATGYNDFDHKFPVQSRQVLDVAIAKGYETIVWITYREDVTYVLPADTDRAVSNYRNMNAELRRIVASGEYPKLQLWDLDDYTEFVSGSWFASDGVHQVRRGSWGVADWISRKMAHLSGSPCPMPWGPAYELEDPCPDPNVVRRYRGYPQLDVLYDV